MNRMKRMYVGAMVLALTIGACAAPPSPTPVTTAESFAKAFNDRNIDGALALLTEDVDWSLTFTAKGANVVRNMLEYSVELNDTWTYSECKLESGAVTCKMTEVGDCQPPSVPMYHADLTLEFESGKISKVSGQVNAEEQAALNEFLPQMFGWASENLPQDFARYSDLEWQKFNGSGTPAGQLSAREFGQLMDLFCTKYKAAMK